MNTLLSRPLRRGLPALAAAGFALQLIPLSQAVAGPPSRKMERQIAIFERIVDEMLVDSPNFLVKGRDDTRGHYVEGEGAVFSFRTSLVGAGWDDHNWWDFWDHDHRRYRDDDDDDRDWVDREFSRQKRKFERGKDEMVDTLIDFGDVLTTLSDTETLQLEARLRTADYFDEADIRKFTVTVKMADIRAFTDGRIDEDALRARITSKES